jgi:hypothetical protein
MAVSAFALDVWFIRSRTALRLPLPLRVKEQILFAVAKKHPESLLTLFPDRPVMTHGHLKYQRILLNDAVLYLWFDTAEHEAGLQPIDPVAYLELGGLSL